MRGDTKPEADHDEAMAITAWNLLSNGSNAIDWSGFAFVIVLLGVTDVEGLVDRLVVIKNHKPPQAEQPGGM